MMINRRSLISAATTAAFLPRVTKAGSFPERPVRVLVPFTPGGTTDLVARTITEAVGRRVSQPVVVENVSGAGGNVGAEQVARAAPNGHNLLVSPPGPAAINQYLYRNMPYDTEKAFSAVSYLVDIPGVLVVGDKTPAKTVQELVALLKSRPNSLNYGSSGAGTTGHLAQAMILARTSTTAQHVAYRGTAPLLLDVVAGNVQFAIDSMPGTIGQIRAGRVRPLAVTSRTRSPLLPDVPTMMEAGFLDFEASTWLALLGPAGMPPGIATEIASLVDAAMQEEAVKARLIDLGATPVGGPPADLDRLLQTERAKWREVVAASGATAE